MNPTFKYLGLYETGIPAPRPLHIYKFGTCHGICMRRTKEDPFVLVAVVNDQPHNGHFGKLMSFLEAKYRSFDVIHIFGKPLQDHLINKRGYKLFDDRSVRWEKA